MDKNFRRYTSCYRWGWKLLGIFSAALIAAMAVCIALGAKVKYAGFPICAVILLGSLVPVLISRRFCGKLASEGIAEKVQRDFDDAMPLCGDGVRLGSGWVFRRGQCSLLAIKDIAQLMLIADEESYGAKQALVVVDKKGAEHNLGWLNILEMGDEQFEDILDGIRRANPGVKVIRR